MSFETLFIMCMPPGLPDEVAMRPCTSSSKSGVASAELPGSYLSEILWLHLEHRFEMLLQTLNCSLCAPDGSG